MANNEDLENDENLNDEDEDSSEEKSETSELEAEFIAVVEKAKEEIAKKLNEAHKALDEATEIADKYGVPFYSSISPLGQKYTPTSFYEKFDAIADVASEITDWENGPGSYEGWEHSAVC